MQIIYDMAYEGKNKAEIARKLGILPTSFYSYKRYNDQYKFGQFRGIIDKENLMLDAYKKVDTKYGMSTKDMVKEFLPTKVDDFTLTKADLADLESIRNASARVLLAFANNEITEGRALAIQKVLESHSKHHRNYVEEEELREKIDNLVYVGNGRR